MKKRTVAKKIFNTVKKSVMSNEPNDRAKHADTIIRNHIIWSMGAGFIPVLIADIFAVSALQLDMIRQMCKIYNVDFSETQGKAIVTSLTSSTLARLGARSLVKMIPGIGSLLGGITVSIFAGASTYALGEVFKSHFESGGTILDFDPDRLRKFYSEKFEKGKQVARDIKKSGQVNEEGTEEVVPPMEDIVEDAVQMATANEVVEEPDDALARLTKLGELKEKGLISKEEFTQMKKKIIEDF